MLETWCVALDHELFSFPSLFVSLPIVLGLSWFNLLNESDSGTSEFLNQIQELKELFFYIFLAKFHLVIPSLTVTIVLHLIVNLHELSTFVTSFLDHRLWKRYSYFIQSIIVSSQCFQGVFLQQGKYSTIIQTNASSSLSGLLMLLSSSSAFLLFKSVPN